MCFALEVIQPSQQDEQPRIQVDDARLYMI